MYIYLWFKEGKRPLSPVEQAELDAKEAEDHSGATKKNYEHQLQNAVITARILSRLTNDPGEKHALEAMHKDAQESLRSFYTDNPDLAHDSAAENDPFYEAVQTVKLDGMMHHI